MAGLDKEGNKLSETFVSESGILCRKFVFMSKEYTMLHVRPDCLLNIKALTRKEILELEPEDFTLTSRITNKL